MRFKMVLKAVVSGTIGYKMFLVTLVLKNKFFGMLFFFIFLFNCHAYTVVRTETNLNYKYAYKCTSYCTYFAPKCTGKTEHIY